MSVDLRLRHDRSLRERAAEMFERGLGYGSVARGLGVPAEAVRNWQKTYRATGRDGLLKMGEKHARYDFETKVAAARAVVDDGMAKPEAMERFGIASATPLKQWCRLYRGGGAEALRPKPKGRPRGSGAKAAPMTREQEPELCFVNLSFHKTASVRFTRQREDSSRTSVALAPILSSPTTPRA